MAYLSWCLSRSARQRNHRLDRGDLVPAARFVCCVMAAYPVGRLFAPRVGLVSMLPNSPRAGWVWKAPTLHGDLAGSRRLVVDLCLTCHCRSFVERTPRLRKDPAKQSRPTPKHAAVTENATPCCAPHFRIRTMRNSVQTNAVITF